nr:wall-associated receptor kinase-like 1 [Ipomoea batatas]
MILRLLLFVFLFFPSAAEAAAPSLAKPGCEEWCGNVSIPYPFGIGESCAVNPWFVVNCDNSTTPPKPYLNAFLKVQGEVVNVSLDNQTITTLKSVVNLCENSAGRNAITNGTDLSGSPFYYSKSRNKFFFSGCGNSLLTQQNNSTVLAGCTAICSPNITTRLTGCYGIDCCETPIPFDLSSYTADFTNSGIQSDDGGPNKRCYNSAFLVDQTWIPKQNTKLLFEYAPVVWTWTAQIQAYPPAAAGCSFADFVQPADGTSISSYRCNCAEGEEGNPYFADGCQAGIMISAGVLVFVLCTFYLYKVLKKRRARRIRAKFFKQNGGLLLQQQLSSNEDDVIDRTKLFTAKELEKATDRFNENRILGRGGQGTVYKGMLADGRIVAVKKSVRVDESKIEEFINEVVILSRVNHRNVVKLLGCCLETEVPLLVYEFITNEARFMAYQSGSPLSDASWGVGYRFVKGTGTKTVQYQEHNQSRDFLQSKSKADMQRFALKTSPTYPTGCCHDSDTDDASSDAQYLLRSHSESASTEAPSWLRCHEKWA